MVAVFVRLRLLQLVNSLRRPPLRLLGMLIVLAYGIAATVYAYRVLSGLEGTPLADARSITIVGGSIITLGFVLVPLFFGADDPDDPRALAALGIPIDRLATYLALAAFIGVSALLLAVVAAGHFSAWNDRTVGPIALISAILVVVTGVLGARVARSIAALWLHGRRVRDLCVVLAMVAVLVATPAVVVVATADWSRDEPFDRLGDWADGLAGTPLGWAWAAPAEAAAGNTADAWLLLALATVFVVVLALSWRLIVRRMLVTPRRAPQQSSTGGLGWFAWLPASPAGAVAARSFTYWARDGRYRLALMAIPVVPVLLVVPLLIAGVWWQNLALIPLPVMCLFLGWMIHNDAASDNTAIWLHVASDTSGWADRLGRTAPSLAIGVPLIAIASPLTAFLYGVPEILPAVFGVCTCLLFAGLGISSYVSVRLPYATVRPGDSPFAQPQSTGSTTGQALSFFGTILVTLPALALAGYGLAEGGMWPLSALVAGLVTGFGVFFLGLSLGARGFSARAPELLAFTQRT